MKTHTVIRSPAAIALGLFFAGVTAYVLFSDVVRGAPITTGHVLALAAIVAAIASGHMAWPALRAGAIVSGLMLMVLCLGATGYVVVSSGARNAEQAGNKAAAIEAANKTRAHEEKLLAEAEAMLADAQAAMARECASGRGKRCQGREATVNVYEAAIKGHKATLGKLAPPMAPGGYQHAAKVLASWGLTVTEDWLALNMPFVTVLIAELGTIAFLHLGLGHVRHQAPTAAPQPAPTKPPGKRAPRTTTASNGRRGRKPDPKVVDFLARFQERNGRAPTGSEIMHHLPEVPRSTAYDYARRATG